MSRFFLILLVVFFYEVRVCEVHVWQTAARLFICPSTTDQLTAQPGMRDSFYRYNVAIVVVIKWRLS